MATTIIIENNTNFGIRFTGPYNSKTPDNYLAYENFMSSVSAISSTNGTGWTQDNNANYFELPPPSTIAGKTVTSGILGGLSAQAFGISDCSDDKTFSFYNIVRRNGDGQYCQMNPGIPFDLQVAVYTETNNSQRVYSKSEGLVLTQYSAPDFLDVSSVQYLILPSVGALIRVRVWVTPKFDILNIIFDTIPSPSGFDLTKYSDMSCVSQQCNVYNTCPSLLPNGVGCKN